MSIYIYEESIVNKLRHITGDNRVIITPSDNVIDLISRINNDEFELPLIHIVRNKWGINSKKQHGLKMNGLIANNSYLYNVEDNISPTDGRIHSMHAIPMVMSHSFEVWSRTRKECDEIIRELIWFFGTMNEFEVDIPYGLNRKHVFSLNLHEEIIDSTDIISQATKGEIFLQAIVTSCDDCYIWKSSSRNPTCINVTGQIVAGDEIIYSHNYDELTREEKFLGGNI